LIPWNIFFGALLKVDEHKTYGATFQKAKLSSTPRSTNQKANRLQNVKFHFWTSSAGYAYPENVKIARNFGDQLMLR
jgi:hypothetical protein